MLTERQLVERGIYNRLVHDKWDAKSLIVPSLQPPFADYSGDLWNGAMKAIGVVQNKRILEIGCGSGELAIWFGLQGAQVIGIDISEESIRIARRRAEENHVASRVNFLVSSGEVISLPNDSFDVVFINVSLHHLEVKAALNEFYRLLVPGGLFVAVEPLVFSKTVQRIRASRLVTLVYPIRQETPTERILTVDDLQLIKNKFGAIKVTAYRLFSPFIFKIRPVFYFLTRVFFREGDWESRKRRCNHWFQKLDEWLLVWIPPLKYLSRYVVILARR